MPLLRTLSLRHKALALVVGAVAGSGLVGLVGLHLILARLVGVDESRQGLAPAAVEVGFLLLQIVVTLVALLLALHATAHLTRPLSELTRVADAISIGELNVAFAFGSHVRCWEIKRCGETSCRAWGNLEVQCWYVDGTPCRGVEPRFPQKLAQCRACEVYQAHRGDEIVQLADAFQNMAYKLRVSQAELLRAERLAATGEAVAVVSHSVKNILDGLLGGAYIYRRGRRLDDPGTRAQGWEMIERNLGAISELIMNLLDFAKARTPFLEPCDAARLISDAAQLHLERARQAGATITTRADADLGPIYLDAHTVFHCLVNLVANALDALAPERPGRIELAVEPTGERVVFTVSDNGVGMAPETVARLFKGIFSTKGSKGTGLGLLSVQKTVGEHGGMVEVSSVPDAGTTFRLVFPLLRACEGSLHKP